MEYVLLGLGLLIVVLLVVVLCQLAAVRRRQSEDAGVKALETRLDRQQSELTAELRAGRQESSQTVRESVQGLSQMLLTEQRDGVPRCRRGI